MFGVNEYTAQGPPTHEHSNSVLAQLLSTWENERFEECKLLRMLAIEDGEGHSALTRTAMDHLLPFLEHRSEADNALSYSDPSVPVRFSNGVIARIPIDVRLVVETTSIVSFSPRVLNSIYTVTTEYDDFDAWKRKEAEFFAGI